MSAESNESRFERWRARGDGAALADVFDALAPGLLRLAIHLVGDPAVAEDLVQQTFVTAMERAPSWDSRRALEPWLQGILTNHARDLRRSARRPHDADFDLEHALARESETPLDAASRRELSGEIARAVDALPEPYRSTVLLRLRHGMDAADIAHVMGRTAGAVRVQLHRAREMLRKSLPVGIAGALALLAEPARGLASVRNQVVEHAARLAPAASVGGGLLGGALVMKKVVIAAAVLLVGLAALLAWRGDDALRSDGADVVASAVELPATAKVERAGEPLEPGSSAGRSAPVVLEPEAAPRERLRGIVLDARTDAPIAGARIGFHAPLRLPLSEIRARWWDRFQFFSDGSLFSYDWPYVDEELTSAQRAGLEPVLVRVDDGAAPIAETTSDAEGRFELAADSVDGLLVCDAAGYARSEVASMSRAAAAGAERVVYLAPTLKLEGRIVDESGRPIRASIPLALYGPIPRTSRAPADPSRAPQGRRRTIRTDNDGRFEADVATELVFVASLDPRWTVEDPRRGDPAQPSWPQRSWFDLVEDSGDALVVLRPAVSLLLRDAVTREPIEHAHVSVRDAASGISSLHGWFHLEGGRLAIGGERLPFSRNRPAQPASGPRTVHAWTPGYARASVSVPDLADTRVVEIDLVRDAAGAVRGRVTHAGSAAEAARILAFEAHPASAVRHDDGAPLAAAIAGPDGRFGLELPAGRFLLTIEHGSRTVRRALDVPCADEIAIELDATAAVRVLVSEASGAPAARRDVRAVDDAGVQSNGTTDARGVVELTDLVPGRHRVQLSHRPAGQSFWAHQEREIVLAAGAVVDVDFVAPSASARHARLVVEDGPVEGWKVQQSPWRGPRVEVDPTGRVPFDLVEDRSFVAVSPGGTLTWILVPEDAPDGYEAHVRSGGLGYRGRALDLATGAPLRDQYVWLRGEGDEATRPPSKLVELDAEGRFEVRGLAAAEYSIRVVSGDGRPSSSGNSDFDPDAPPADPPVELVLRRPRFAGGDYEGLPGVALHGRIVGRVDDMTGGMVFVSTRFPQDGCSLWIHDEARVQADGTFRMRMRSSQEAKLAVWTGTNPPRRLIRETWRPSGADPELREFALP